MELEFVNGETQKHNGEGRNRKRSDRAMHILQNPGGGGRGIRRGSTPVEEGGELFVEEEEDEIPRFLPPDEPLGGYIFMCTLNTLPRITELMVFGYPDVAGFRYSVQAITPGLPLFLYNLTTRHYHGVYEAAGNGGYNIEPGFFPNSHDPTRSSYPAQVRVRWRTEYQPLDEENSDDILILLRIRRINSHRYRVELKFREAAFIISAFDGFADAVLR